MEKAAKYRLVAGIIAFGSLWGMLECILGSVRLSGALAYFPVGALLGGFFGLGLMTMTRRIFGVPWMQLGMGIVAGLLRFWAPIGTCVVCSALAIVAESAVFELIFNRKALAFYGERAGALGVKTLVPLGIIAGYAIYVTGYVFTQIFTPIIAPPHMFVFSDLVNNMPLILGRGFFAAIFGGISLPIAVLYGHKVLEPSKVAGKYYYAASLIGALFCWVAVLAFFWLI